jgi:phosphomannomutase
MRKERAVMGGELSGHYYFRDNFVSDSGELAMLVMLSILGRKGGSAQALLRPFDRLFFDRRNQLPRDDPAGVLAALKKRYANGQVDELDGVTVQYPDWWFNVRKSNTEPLVRLNLEADSAAPLRREAGEVAALLGRAEE